LIPAALLAAGAAYLFRGSLSMALAKRVVVGRLAADALADALSDAPSDGAAETDASADGAADALAAPLGVAATFLKEATQQGG